MGRDALVLISITGGKIGQNKGRRYGERCSGLDLHYRR